MITTYDQLTAAIAQAQKLDIYKAGGSSLAEAAGEFSSLWVVAGRPSAAAAPSVGLNGETLTKSSAGAIPITDPTGANTKYLAAANLSITTAGTVVMYDRLWQNSGIDVTATGAQALSSVALPARDENDSTNGVGVFPWLEVYTATTNGAAVTGGTISYTNSDGTAGRTGTIQSIAATAVAGTMVPIILQAGDVGVRSIQSITLGTSLVSGAVGLVLGRDLVTIPLTVANAGPFFGWDAIATKIKANSCLALRLLNTSTTRGALFGTLTFIEG